MKFHINIKFRAFGVTFGTIDQVVDGTATLSTIATTFLASIAKTIPAAALLDLPSLLGDVKIPPHVIYNDRGVLLEILSS